MSPLFHKAIHMVDAVMRQVKEEDFTKPTPCSEWDVKALANHIIYEVAWVQPLLDGKTIAEVGDALNGDLIGEDLQASWHKHMQAAMKAANDTPPEAIAQLSYGPKPAMDYLNEVGGDIVVHGWDLAKAIGAEYMIDDITAKEVEDGTRAVMVQARESGDVAAALEPAPGATVGERLIAYYGRDINWGR